MELAYFLIFFRLGVIPQWPRLGIIIPLEIVRRVIILLKQRLIKVVRITDRRNPDFIIPYCNSKYLI